MVEAVRCTDCPGWVVPGRFDVVRLPQLDADGNRVYTPDGKPAFVNERRPYHIPQPSTFDPTGLAIASCTHGLAHHPNPVVDAQGLRLGRSWIKARYLKPTRGGSTCPVCRNEPRPDDLTAGYTDPEEVPA